MLKIPVIIAGILGIIGVIVEVGFDMDNVYDMTTTALFVIILILSFVGAFMGGRPKPQPTVPAGSNAGKGQINP